MPFAFAKLALLCLILSACTAQRTTPYVDLSIGTVLRSSNYIEGCDPTVRVAGGVHKGGVYAEIAHNSNYSCGWPANNKSETWLDTFSVGYRKEFH